MRSGRSNRIAFSRAGVLSLLTAVCVICTACGDGQTAATTTAATTSADAATTSVTTAATVSTSSALPVEVETTQAPAAAATEEAESAQTSVTYEDVSAVDSQPTEESPTTQPPETTVPAATTTVATTTVATTTTQATTATTAPPAQIVIPTVKQPTSPQTSAKVTDTAVIDWSNASEGYIGASYSGSSKRAKLRIVCGDVTYDHDLAVDGSVEYFPLSQGSGDYFIAVYEQLEGKSYMEAASVQTTLGISDEVQMYLYPNKYVMFDQGSDCVYKGAELCAGMDGTIEKLAAIFGWITDNITYDYDLAATVVSGYIPDPDALLEKRSGICFDYASLFAAMARSQGIPTRLVIGYASPDIYHAWNEVYTEETGWISAELLLKQKGYNLVDSTFYASAADKAAISEYISNSGNYSAIYRY